MTARRSFAAAAFLTRERKDSNVTWFGWGVSLRPHVHTVEYQLRPRLGGWSRVTTSGATRYD